MIPLEPGQFETIAETIGDTPFTVTPYFHLRRRTCDVYADDANQPHYGAIIPHTPRPDVYLFGANNLEPGDVERVVGFLAGLETVGGYILPVGLVAPLRARRRIDFDVEGLCFSYRQAPRDFVVWRPELVRRMDLSDLPQVEGLPQDAGFLHQSYGSAAVLLAEGLSFGVFQADRLVSMAASLVLTPKHCDVGAYTRRRYRSRGYATDCVEALFAHVLARDIHPLWRIGVRQKIAIYFAEKLELDEIGTDGQEVYLQAR
jgi:hypothetical protein